MKMTLLCIKYEADCGLEAFVNLLEHDPEKCVPWMDAKPGYKP